MPALADLINLINLLALRAGNPIRPAVPDTLKQGLSAGSGSKKNLVSLMTKTSRTPLIKTRYANHKHVTNYKSGFLTDLRNYSQRREMGTLWLQRCSGKLNVKIMSTFGLHATMAFPRPETRR